MVKISPSMLSCDFSKIGEEIKRAESSGADFIHFDVMDGIFVPNLTFGSPVIKSNRKITKLPFDTHLMISKPELYIKDFADAGCDYITVHVEVGEHAKLAFKEMKDRGIKAGITLNPATPIDSIKPFLDEADLVLIMTVNAGFGGQKFNPDCLKKIQQVRDWKVKNNPNLLISVDGGVNSDDYKDCIDAGADILVSGSALFGSKDMRAEISKWKSYSKE